MKPLIGITLAEDIDNNRVYLASHYFNVIEEVGGVPLLLPPLQQKETIAKISKLLDGLILSGGVDVDPVYIGQEPMATLGQITPNRDLFEIVLTKQFLAEDKPILAICRGIQLLNIAAGGTIYQDISSQIRQVIKHSQNAPRWYPTHKVKISKGSRLQEILGESEIRVNSFHHQAVNELAGGFKVSAVSVDGVIEAIEGVKNRFVLGLQWHPECMWDRDINSLKIFEGFFKAINK